MGFLQGKRALVTGIASQRSIATGIAEAMHRQGAELALTYQTEKLRSRVEDAGLPARQVEMASLDLVHHRLPFAGECPGQQLLETVGDAGQR